MFGLGLGLGLGLTGLGLGLGLGLCGLDYITAYAIASNSVEVSNSRALLYHCPHLYNFKYLKCYTVIKYLLR